MKSKAKTRKSALKRFKITGSGKIMRRVGFGRHLLRKKTANQKRRYGKKVEVVGKIARRVKRLMARA